MPSTEPNKLKLTNQTNKQLRFNDLHYLSTDDRLKGNHKSHASYEASALPLSHHNWILLYYFNFTSTYLFCLIGSVMRIFFFHSKLNFTDYFFPAATSKCPKVLRFLAEERIKISFTCEKDINII